MGNTVTFVNLLGRIEPWQPLIAGLIAIVAALMGGRYINKQIAASDRIEQERRQRKFAASRAVLPLTLSALINYASQCNLALKAILLTKNGVFIPKQPNLQSFPPLPSDIVTELRVMIEYADAPVSKAATRLLGGIQVQIARLKSLHRDLMTSSSRAINVSEVEEYIIDTAEIYAWCAAFFEFAREESNTVPVALTYKENLPDSVIHKDIWSSLNQTGFMFVEEHAKHVHRRAEERFGAKGAPSV